MGKFKTKNNLTVELAESMIMGNELSMEKQQWIFERAQVCIEGCFINMKTIILDRNDMVGVLSGKLLNRMLQQKCVRICAYKYPE